MGREDTGCLQGAVALVTGATGFVGRHVCRVLMGQGAHVYGVSRRAQARDDLHAWHVADLSDAGAVDRLIESISPDYVFHLAGHVAGARDRALVKPTLRDNLLSTINLLEAVTGTSCRRLVLAGSLEEPGREGDAPSSPYAASKAAAAIYASLFWRLYQTPVTIARLFMVYGPDQPDTRKLVPFVTLSLLSGRSPELTSGKRPVDWVHVEDVALALARCAIADGLQGETIDIGTGRLTTVRGVAEKISRLVGDREPIFGAIEDRACEQIRAADPTRAEQLLGRRMIDLDEGLKQTVQWYREHALASSSR